jgi:hypothetical protein
MVEIWEMAVSLIPKGLLESFPTDIIAVRRWVDEFGEKLYSLATIS